MNMTPQIEATLDKLVNLCGACLKGEQSLDREELSLLVENLSTNGWTRFSSDSEPLSVEIGRRAKDQFPESTIHRGAELQSIVAEVQAAYENLSQRLAKAPDNVPDSSMSPRTSD